MQRDNEKAIRIVEQMLKLAREELEKIEAECNLWKKAECQARLAVLRMEDELCKARAARAA
jgi:hypothetical protein